MIPVGPDFQDPVGSREYAPVVNELTPAFGSLVTVSFDLSPQITVIASDLNSGDSLYWEWVLDYPPYVQGTTRNIGSGMAGPPTSGPQVQTIPQPVTCGDGPNPNGPTLHQLQVIVCDRPLKDIDGNVAVPDPGGQIAKANWTVTFSCPPGSS